MIQDYSISRCTRKCAISGRGLEPGENYYSVIVPQDDDLVRIDIAASQWTGPGEHAIGWWRSKMPVATAHRTRPAPNGVLLDTLSELLERPGKESLAYLLALLLVRRRVLQEEQPSHPLASAAPSDAARTHWNLTCPADGRQWMVTITIPTPEQLEALQEELKGLLFVDE